MGNIILLNGAGEVTDSAFYKTLTSEHASLSILVPTGGESSSGMDIVSILPRKGLSQCLDAAFPTHMEICKPRNEKESPQEGNLEQTRSLVVSFDIHVSRHKGAMKGPMPKQKGKEESGGMHACAERDSIHLLGRQCMSSGVCVEDVRILRLLSTNGGRRQTEETNEARASAQKALLKNSLAAPVLTPKRDET